jgi:hypothetical protein
MSYSWKITLNSIDISDKISGFSITCSLDSFCREMTLDIIDTDLYASFDFSQVSETPEIEIFTKNGSTFVSQGKFFIERPAIASTINSDTMQGVWGRSITAMLSEPFAPKITKSWETQTTFFGICEEVCDLAGFTWSPAYSDIADFVIYPYTYEAENLYPIDVITELAALAGAVVTTDRAGHLCIKEVVYSPSVADKTITDADIAEISDAPEWPVFANRLRITPTGNTANYSINLTVPNQCLSADAVSKTKLFAQVRDPDGNPINGIVVNWSHDSITASLAYETSNTQEILIQNERQKATGYRSFKTSIPASSIDGVWAYTDTGKTVNLATGGYTIDGDEVTLTTRLSFCDQSLVVNYRAAGMAINWLTAGPAADDVTVTADVEGQQDKKVIYIENPCQCPPDIKLTAAPGSIIKNELASLLVYVEEAGPVAGRVVYVYEASEAKKGTLGWTTARVGQVSIKNEKTAARNEIAGVTQCEVSMFPASVSAVYRADENGAPYGANLYASSNVGNKTVNLTTSLTTGTELVVTYVAQGAALNTFTGSKLGDAKINAFIRTTSEESKEDSANIRITDNTKLDGYPDGADEDDGVYEEPGGFSDDFEPDNGSFCVQTDGTKVKCAKGERCCSDGYTTGCRPTSECVGGQIDPCYPASIQGQPDAQTLGMRFDTGLQYGCTCEQMCNNEFDIFGTTQGYDGASGKKISGLALEQCGTGCVDGSPAYWEKHAELKAAALADCIAACQCAEGMAWDTVNSPETIVAGSSVQVFVTGGRGPFTWSVSGLGYSLLVAETVTGTNQVTCADGVCGVDYDPYCTITIADACDANVSASLRNTGGEWVFVGNTCGIAFGATEAVDAGSGSCEAGTSERYTRTLISGYQKQIQGQETCVGSKTCSDPDCTSIVAGGCDKYGFAAQGSCLIPSGQWCTCINPYMGDDCVYRRTYLLEYYEWGCP